MVLLLMISVGVIGANSLVLSPIAAEVALGLGASSAAQIMTAAAIYGICVAGSAMLLAPRADRIGAAAALKTAITILLLGLGLSTFAPSLLILSVGQGVSGIGAGMALPAIYSLAAQISAPGKEARTIGMVLTGWTLSMVGGVTLSAFIAELWSWRAVFAVLAVALVAIALGLRNAPFPAHTPAEHSTSPISAMRVPGIWPALFSVAMLGTGFYAVYNYLGAHLQTALTRPVSDAGLLTLSYGLGFGAAMLFDPVLDKVGPRRGLVAVFSLLTLFYLAMATGAGNYTALVGLMFGWGVIQHLGLNLTVGRLGALDASQRGAIMGLNSTVMYLSVFAATVLFRPVFEGSGLAACMLGSAALAALGAGEALIARLRDRRAAMCNL